MGSVALCDIAIYDSDYARGLVGMLPLRNQKTAPTEREKLQASYVNGLAIGVGVVAGVGPLVNAAVTGTLGFAIPMISLAGFGISYYLHRTATKFLKVTEDDR